MSSCSDRYYRIILISRFGTMSPTETLVGQKRCSAAKGKAARSWGSLSRSLHQENVTTI
ncbi:MAG: hypothetical protein F6K65_25040 [Moorea sp. SIO3C2]|nr:hypothetical protein [Moorena sp. SIO3C2]